MSRAPWIVLALLMLVPLRAGAFLVNEWEPIVSGHGELEVAEAVRDGNRWQEPVAGIVFNWVAGGCFKMGSPPREENRSTDEGPVHEACVSGFWLGATEVTQGQWKRVMQANPSKFRKGDDFPVERVAWEDVEIYIRRLTTMNKNRYHFRLPTEAEWEFACRSLGHRERYSGSNDVEQVAWYAGNSSDSTAPAVSKKENWLGLRNMSGNVWEWVADSYQNDAYSKHQKSNPLVINGTIFKVMRGGGWHSPPSGVRCTNRGYGPFSLKQPDIGLRLVRSTGEVEKERPQLQDLAF